MREITPRILDRLGGIARQISRRYGFFNEDAFSIALLAFLETPAHVDDQKALTDAYYAALRATLAENYHGDYAAYRRHYNATPEAKQAAKRSRKRCYWRDKQLRIKAASPATQPPTQQQLT